MEWKSNRRTSTRRMILASESASQAAAAAVKALEEFQKQQVAGSDEKGWYKLLPKLTAWEPKTEKKSWANGEIGRGP